MAYLKGYSAVPGSARRVKTPTGEIISHRQYRNITARDAGWTSLSQAETDKGWRHWRERIRENNPKAALTLGTDKGRKLQADYNAVRTRREAVPPVKTVRGWRHDPTLEPIGKEMGATPLGRMLAAMGAVDESDFWAKYPAGK